MFCQIMSIPQKKKKKKKTSIEVVDSIIGNGFVIPSHRNRTATDGLA